jgi:hypothetical protein
MQVRVLDLDGSIRLQNARLSNWHPEFHSLQPWAPAIRLTCSFGRFRRFETALARALAGAMDSSPAVTLYGSGDFHHVSLALIRRLPRAVNLLVLDNHPDWMRGVPLLHCGTWLYHAVRLPHVVRVYHVGGDVDFDNGYRWMAPWPQLRSGKITVIPAYRPYHRGPWARIPHTPLRAAPAQLLTQLRLEELLEPFRGELAARPLYVSVDKDVFVEEDAIVNWDSGHLRLEEGAMVLESFLRAAGGELAGADIVGDWSPVQVRGWLRWFLHRTEHPPLLVRPEVATARNEAANLRLLECLIPEPVRAAGRANLA